MQGAFACFPERSVGATPLNPVVDGSEPQSSSVLLARDYFAGARATLALARNAAKPKKRKAWEEQGAERSLLS